MSVLQIFKKANQSVMKKGQCSSYIISIFILSISAKEESDKVKTEIKMSFTIFFHTKKAFLISVPSENLTGID
jgi:hypothetical protein